MSDNELWEARVILRTAYHALGRLPQRNATVRELSRELDDLIAGATAELDAIEPEFRFRLQELVR